MQSTRGLDEKLDELRREFELGGDFPDVVAAWEAIGRILTHNRLQSDVAPFPLPEWVSNYLAQAADKIGRLELGIRPEDNRPLGTIPFDEVGELRKVPHAGRSRDDRTRHLAGALGFVRNGVTAFQRHDRTRLDALYLHIHDDREATPQVRRAVVQAMKTVGTAEGGRNRLSKARRRSRKCNQT